MHEGIPILNYLVPKAFTHDNGKLTGVMFEKVKAEYDAKGRRKLVPTGEPDEHLRMRRRAGRGRPGERLPVDRARHRHRVRPSGTCRWSTRRPLQSTHPEGVLRRRRRVRPEEHHLGGGARPRRGDLDRPALPRRGRHRAPAADGRPRQPEDGHPRVELRQRHLQRQALPGAAARQGDRAERHQGRGRARLRPRARASRRRSAASTATCRRCSPTTLCIECDACVDICPMDCITFTANGEEADLRTRLQGAGAEPRRRTSTSPATLKTGRVMVKDEDVCLHCGLCAERCPTGAWDMQKFLLDMTHADDRMPNKSTQSSSVNDFVVKFANVNGSGSASAPTSCSRKSILRMGVPVSPRNIFPSNIQGLPTWYEVRVSEAGLSRPARRRRPDGRDEPADLGQGRRRDRAGRLPVLRLDQAAAAVEVPRRHHRDRHAADRRSATANTPTRASASCSRTSSMSARSRRCSTSTWRRSRS